jgi:hypothetical protein
MLPFEREPMPHIQQRLLVHRLVFEDRKRRLGTIEQRISSVNVRTVARPGQRAW